MGSYDYAGIAVGNAMQDIGLQMFRDKREAKRYEQERKIRGEEEAARNKAEREERARFEAPKQEAREEVRDGKRVKVTYEWDTSGDRGKWREVSALPIEATVKGIDEVKDGDTIRSFERLSDGTRRPLMVDGRAVSAPRYRPSNGAQPQYDMLEVNGQLQYVPRGAQIPQGARKPGGKTDAAGMSTRDAASLIQTYRKNPGEVTEGDKTRDQTVREAMEADGLDYEAVLARANGKDPKAKPKAGGRSPLMAITDSVIGAGRQAMSAATSPRAASAPGSGPKPGDVMDGFQFMGGDPADPNSWKKM